MTGQHLAFSCCLGIDPRPTEEDAAEDHAELVQLHERWEKVRNIGIGTWRVKHYRKSRVETCLLVSFNIVFLFLPPPTYYWNFLCV